ncbi:UNC-like C-terminal-domain-containing protein [Mycena sp. CBHHK59/15]|nr:UNC-like C-terminal-domain-containing protein [Mycena sp. CBHHK59/15]
MFPALPAALIALILASPLFAAPTSFNDPFKALAAQAVKPPDPPVCCLTPLPPTEPIQDDVLLSFEEWKEKRFAMQTLVQAKEKERESANGDHAVEGSNPAAPAADLSNSPAVPQDAPHFRVPITDRFNYAGLDCSARVHTSHRAAKSPSSILSSKRDRYMLSPCHPPKGEQQFIVVELCEDIRIDTVQLANFEFFSGVFKDFTVSVSKTYTTDPEGWTFASTHTAKNIRVVQSFHPPTSLRDFYRYIRIDFHSHYSNEYYCPISLLRVYGLTHLEEYKWDIWETESRARARRDEQLVPSAPLEVEEPAPTAPPVQIPSSYEEYIDTASTRENASASGVAAGTKADPVGETHSQTAPDVDTVISQSLPLPATCEPSEITDSTATSIPLTTTPQQKQQQSKPQTKSDVSVDAQQQQRVSTTPESPVPADAKDATSVPPSASAAIGPTTTTTSTMTTTTTVPTATTMVSTLSTTTPVPATISTGAGESIYRTIMNRLTALEANHTLYARYVEEHTGAVREMLRRVGEDLGRSEGVGKAQAQMYSRTLLEWERHRKRVDAEYRELIRRVEYLSDEIVLEKRLGIAQLLLLLAVLVFMTLTRGSRGEAVLAPSVSRSALRAWGRRHLSLKSFNGSGDWDWVGRLKSHSRSHSPKPKPNPPKPKSRQVHPPIKLEFPSTQQVQSPAGPSNAGKPRPPRLNLRAHSPRPRSRTRSLTNTAVYDGQRARPRTPTLLRTPHWRPRTPTQAYTPSLPSTLAPGPIQHSISQGSHAPRSARRWARSAHLHEIRGVYSPNANAGEARSARVGVDVFSSPTPSGAASADLLDLRGARVGLIHGLPPSPAMRDPVQAVSIEDAGEGDPWVDMDDGSELDVDGDADVGVESPWVERAALVA